MVEARGAAREQTSKAAASFDAPKSSLKELTRIANSHF
jgi:hypothetical protein